MKRVFACLFAVLAVSGAASAQQQSSLPGFLDFDGGVVGRLLANDGVVFSLVETVETLDFSHVTNATAAPDGDSGLAQGSIGAGAHAVLTGLLVNQDLSQTSDGLAVILDALLVGLQRGLVGEDFLSLGGLLGGNLLGGGLLGGDLLGGGIPIVGTLLGGNLLGDGLLDSVLAIVDNLLGDGLLGGGGPLAILDGLLGGGGGLPVIGDLLGGNLLGGGIPVVGGLLNGNALPGL